MAFLFLLFYLCCPSLLFVFHRQENCSKKMLMVLSFSHLKKETELEIRFLVWFALPMLTVSAIARASWANRSQFTRATPALATILSLGSDFLVGGIFVRRPTKLILDQSFLSSGISAGLSTRHPAATSAAATAGVHRIGPGFGLRSLNETFTSDISYFLRGKATRQGLE